MAQMNMIQALNSAMDVMMERDPTVVVMGEDVGYFGGVFRCTDGLQKKYGEHRVFDYADRRRRHRRRGHRHGGERAAARRGDPVRRLHLSGVRPDRQRAGAHPLSQRRRVHRAGHDAHALRRRHPRRPDALAESGSAVRARLRHQGGDAVESVRRQGPADRRRSKTTTR